MNKFYIIAGLTALVGGYLGYVLRGPVQTVSGTQQVSIEPHSSVKLEEPTTVNEPDVAAETESGRTHDIPIAENVAVLTSTSSRPRAAYERPMRDRLKDFFQINGIGTDRADQIVQELIDTDHNLAQKGNAVLERALAEKADQIAQGETVRVIHSDEEKADLDAERESRYRAIFGEYYEAHEKYRRSYPQRRIVGSLSSRLETPLEYVAKETLVDIMYEENTRTVPESASDDHDHESKAMSNEEAEEDAFQLQLRAKESYNQRVLDRSKAYLSTSELEALTELLESDVRRYELLKEISEL